MLLLLLAKAKATQFMFVSAETAIKITTLQKQDTIITDKFAQNAERTAPATVINQALWASSGKSHSSSTSSSKPTKPVLAVSLTINLITPQMAGRN